MERSRFAPSSPPALVRFSSDVHIALAADADEFYRVTYLSFAEFTLLHAYLHNTLLTTRIHKKSDSPHFHLIETQLSTADQLLLWLFHLAGDRTVQLTMQFGHLHPATVFRYVDHVTFCVNEVLANVISWPTPEQRKLMYGMMSVCEEAIAVLDGTHCRIQAPSAYNNLFYSGYKHCHTKTTLYASTTWELFCTLKGRLLDGRMTEMCTIKAIYQIIKVIT